MMQCLIGGGVLLALGAILTVILLYTAPERNDWE